MNPAATSQHDTQITAEAVLSRAQDLLPTFLERIEDVPYEDKGVFFSEMLFVYAAAGDSPSGPVLESGRARGQSTFVLGRIFPGTTITSVEFDRDSPDASVAEGRLKDFSHVNLLYGDSQKLLFDHLQPGAVIIIDGPKGFRAIRLALLLLRTGKTRMVFIHDVYKGLATRRFLERNAPGTLFSDDPAFVEKYKHLDEPCWRSFDEQGRLEWRPAHADPSSYGPTFACLPYDSAVNYARLLTLQFMANLVARKQKTLGKLFGKRGGD